MAGNGLESRVKSNISIHKTRTNIHYGLYHRSATTVTTIFEVNERRQQVDTPLRLVLYSIRLYYFYYFVSFWISSPLFCHRLAFVVPAPIHRSRRYLSFESFCILHFSRGATELPYRFVSFHFKSN